ncbi:MAG: hypothetical protein PHW63_07630 [Alphaproteobacteria bacterium]|nr:hypothetical protein [Alphaproteobacteria bacterium]
MRVPTARQKLPCRHCEEALADEAIQSCCQKLEDWIATSLRSSR